MPKIYKKQVLTDVSAPVSLSGVREIMDKGTSILSRQAESFESSAISTYKNNSRNMATKGMLELTDMYKDDPIKLEEGLTKLKNSISDNIKMEDIKLDFETDFIFKAHGLINNAKTRAEKVSMDDFKGSVVSGVDNIMSTAGQYARSVMTDDNIVNLKYTDQQIENLKNSVYAENGRPVYTAPQKRAVDKAYMKIKSDNIENRFTDTFVSNTEDAKIMYDNWKTNREKVMTDYGIDKDSYDRLGSYMNRALAIEARNQKRDHNLLKAEADKKNEIQGLRLAVRLEGDYIERYDKESKRIAFSSIDDATSFINLTDDAYAKKGISKAKYISYMSKSKDMFGILFEEQLEGEIVSKKPFKFSFSTLKFSRQERTLEGQDYLAVKLNEIYKDDVSVDKDVVLMKSYSSIYQKLKSSDVEMASTDDVQKRVIDKEIQDYVLNKNKNGTISEEILKSNNNAKENMAIEAINSIGNVNIPTQAEINAELKRRGL